MALSNEKAKEFMKRLLMSRLRILVNHGFYGLLLMHMTFTLDESCQTAATDGRRIFFGPEFLDDLSDSELDFVMMHEIMHVVLQHCMRGKELDQDLFNVACDIVVNSNILKSNNMDLSTITLRKYGEAMHRAPNGSEGYEHMAEEVYKMFPARPPRKKPGAVAGAGSGLGSGDGNGAGGTGTGGGKDGAPGWDDHTRWGMEEEEDEKTLKEEWVKRTIDAAEAISVRDPSNTRGMLPMFAVRLLKELREPQTDWRKILSAFVQEEIVDYSFSPPDRRFGDSPFFLPDFNDTDIVTKDILFMIDTSGSMSDDMITAAYSEVKGAVDQFGGKLKGWLGFFDAAIVEPKPFENEGELRIIRPAGGGGTSFHIIFEYVKEYMQDNLPVSIIIMTDGYAPFPKEAAAMGIPVLWLLNNESVTPPWGKIARLTV